MKPIDTRLLEARSRARTSHVRIYTQADGSFKARSSGGDWYTISNEHDGRGWACSCKGYFYTGMCLHASALVRRSEREGWFITKWKPAPYVPDHSQAAD